MPWSLATGRSALPRRSRVRCCASNRPPAQRLPIGQSSAHVVFESGYVELTQIDSASRDHHLAPWVGRHFGLHILALGVDDITAAHERCRSAGVPVRDPARASRAVEYGSRHGEARFEWFMLEPAASPEGSAVPRPARDAGAGTPARGRVPSERRLGARGGLRRHGGAARRRAPARHRGRSPARGGRDDRTWRMLDPGALARRASPRASPGHRCLRHRAWRDLPFASRTCAAPVQPWRPASSRLPPRPAAASGWTPRMRAAASWSSPDRSGGAGRVSLRVPPSPSITPCRNDTTRRPSSRRPSATGTTTAPSRSARTRRGPSTTACACSRTRAGACTWATCATTRSATC